jgi:hypothetical protein
MSPAPAWRPAVAAASSAALLALLFAASGPACLEQGRCEWNDAEMCTTSADGGVQPCRGRILDDKTWELVPMQGEEWVEFPAQRNWIIPLRDAKTGKKLEGEVIEVNTWIATEKKPFWQTISGGNLSEYGPQYGPDVTRIQVHNDTCAPYFLRVLVRTTGPAPKDGGSEDASTDALADAPSDAPDGGAADASAD